MRHLLNICNINGAEVEPVDIITFGAPCQDLSVAGRRSGLKHVALGDDETTRSGLFFEAIRIIKETREATNGTHPRFAIYENVPGAFSSNKGHDFHAVLEALCSVCDSTVSIPRPSDPKRPDNLVWNGAGEIVGDNYSVAWRTLDAQYWGVPQRRKRIYLVADFRGGRAGEILFKPEGLRGNLQEGNETGQGASADAVGGVDGGAGNCLAAGFCQGASPAAQTIGYQEEIAPTVKGAPSGTAQVPAVVVVQDGSETARTLAARYDSSPCADRGQNVVCYDARNHNAQDISGTIQAKPNGGQSLNFINPVCFQNTGHGWWNESEVAATVRTACGGDSVKANLVAQETLCFDETQITSPANGNNPQWNEPSHPLASTARPPTVICKQPPRRYIIRRLTPTECARLQGFPDKWGYLAAYDPADAEFWEDVRKTHAEINGKKYKPVKNLKKWYDKLHTDSAEYKAYGNGLALPCAKYVIRGIAEQGAKTLGSLFDGIGGFPLAGVLNGITPLWASEVEPYPIAVTKSRFGGTP